MTSPPAPAPHRPSGPARTARRAGVVLTVCALLAAGVYAGVVYLRPEVAVTRLRRGPVVAAFYSTGTISPEREYPVRAQVTGTVKEMRVDKGDKVARGQLLAIVEDPRLALSLATAEAQLREAAALADEKSSPSLADFDVQIAAAGQLLEIAQREFDRMSKMRDVNAASASDLDRASDRVKQIASELGSLKARRAGALLSLRRQREVAEASVVSARAELDRQNVYAPIDGVVLDRPTPFGTRVDAAMSNHLMTVADVRQESLVMRAQVDEEDVARVTVDQSVKMTLYAFGDDTFDGRVLRIYDKADESRRTFEVDVAVRAPGKRLSAGMTGELAFILEQRPSADVLPASCLQIRIRPRRDGERPGAGDPTSAAAAAEGDVVREPVVWLVRDGRLYPTPVGVGLRSVERIEITSGLTDADDVVTSPVDPRTPEGRRVRTRPATPLKPDRNAAPPPPDASAVGR